MKKRIFLIIFLVVITARINGQVSINEVSFFTSPQFIELNGPTNFNLSGWQLNFYKGNGQYFASESLNGFTMPSTSYFSGENKSLLAIDTSKIKYSSPPGGYVTLIDNNGNIIQFLAFQGAAPRTLSGSTSEDIGTASSGESLQVTDTGWISDTPTKGSTNAAQSTLPVKRDEIPGFNVYPNPVKNGKILISTDSFSNKFVTIYSILGSVVYQREIRANETIDVGNLSTGLYFVQVEEDQKVSVKKIVIN